MLLLLHTQQATLTHDNKFPLTRLERNYILKQTNQRSLLNTTNHKITA